MSYKPVAFGFQTPAIISGWGGQFYPPSLLSSYLYDIPGQVLYTVYPQEQYDVWLQVPTSIAQQLSIAGKQYSSAYGYPDPAIIYNTNIKGIFPQCLLAENGAPLLCENGNNLVISTGQVIQ